MSMLAITTAVQADTRFGGVATLSAAFETNTGRGQRAELLLAPDIEWRSPFGFDLKAIGRVRMDGLDRLEPGQPSRREVDELSRPAVFGSHVEAELRELFIEGPVGQAWLRLGKQQIVWGEADGLKLLDVVNPQSFREFILEDFVDSRIPQWSAKLEWTLAGYGNAQLIYIPDLSVDVLPPGDGRFAITARELVPSAPPGVAVTFLPDERPDNQWRDGGMGAQWSFRLGRWDLTLNTLRNIRSTPAVFLTPSEEGIDVQRVFEPSNTFGGSAANSIGDFTIRSEIAWSNNQAFVAADPSINRGVVRAETLNLMIGLDWMGLTDTFISGQLFNSRLLDASGVAVRGRDEFDATLLLERTLLNQTVTLGALVIQDLDDGDGLISPRATYQWDTHLQFGLRSDFFHGRALGRFGQFKRQDRVLITLQYSL